jgi:hypothetical protein
MYAILGTRPDLTYAVSTVSKYSSNPNKTHWASVKRIFRYLNGTKHLGITYGGTKELNLIGYSDSDWGGDLDTRRSTSGHVFLLGNGATSWYSKLQSSVATSTMQAEYIALYEATRECIWLNLLLKELGRNETTTSIPIPIYIKCDNQSCIALAKNPENHARSKHIEIKYHFIREKIEDKSVEILYCPTEEMIADIFTKQISKVKFEEFRSMMKMDSII